MKVVALAGESGVGKSTIAQQLFRPLGYLDVALADEIKVRAVATGVTTFEEVFVGPKTPEVRTWLQEEGTERGRQVFGEDVWCRALFARLRKYEYFWGANQFVVTDVRFPSEVRYIRNNGGIVLRVDAPHRLGTNRLTQDQRQHSSETALSGMSADDFDGVVLNDPAYGGTVAWQIQAHLYMARLGTRTGRRVMDYRGVPEMDGLTVSQKCALLRLMFPQYDWNDAE